MNFALDFFLVFGPPQMGVAGAAIATTVSQYISLGVLLWMLVRGGRLNLVDLFEVPPREEIVIFLKARGNTLGVGTQIMSSLLQADSFTFKHWIVAGIAAVNAGF